MTPVAPPPPVPPPPPAVPREAYRVVPAELGDPDIDARIHHRVRLRERSVAWPVLDRAPWRAQTVDADRYDEHGAIGETASAVRVVFSDHAAVFAVWLRRADLRTVALVDVLLDREPGAKLFAGAPVGALEARGDDAKIELLDSTIDMQGWVDRRALGEIWISRGHRGARQESDHQLAARTPIRARPDEHAHVLASSETELFVTPVAAPRDGWQELRVEDEYAAVRGWVPARAVSGEGGGFAYGIGGHHLAITDTDRLDVAAGTCLFDSAGGEVMGVETVADNRYAYRPTSEQPGWWQIYLDTEWGAQTVWVHEVGGALEACANGR